MASWLDEKDVQAAKADEWLNTAKAKTQAWLTSFTGAATPMPDQTAPQVEQTPAMPQIKLPSAEELRALAPWRDLDPLPQQQAPAAASGAPVAMPTTGGAAEAPSIAAPAPRPVQAATGGNYGEIDNSSRASFVRTAYPYMLDAANGDTNLAELMLAKAISENGDVGKGGGFIGNNFSGIKGEGDAGSFEADTWEDYGNGRVNIRDRFAAYSTPQAGFRAFMQFLHDNERYAPALQRYQQTGDASQLFRDIRAAGYATDPIWAEKVENIRATQVAPIVRGQANQDMQRLSLNAAQPLAPGGSAAPPAPGGVSSAPSGAPPAPWEMPGASDGGPMMLKENDETAAFLPGDGGVAPTPEYDPRDADAGPRESRPAPIMPTDPTVSDPAYTQNPNAAPMVDPLDPSTITPAALPPMPNGPRMMQPQPQYRDPREGQGIIARGIDAIGQYLPSAPIVDTKPGDAGAFMGGMPNTAGKLWEWRGRVAEGAADALSRGTGMDPDALVLNVEVGGIPIQMTVSELLENVTDPLLAAGWGVGDMVLDAAGRAVLRLVAPYAKGAARETIGRLLNSEPVQRGVEAVREGAEAVGRGLQGVGREVAGGLMDLNPAMTPRIIGDGPGIGRSMPGPDDVPTPSSLTPPAGGRPQQRTVEWLQEQIDYTRRVLADLDPATEGELIGQVQDRLARLQGEWVDATNARRALEPRIRSEVGRRVNELPIDERTASDFAGIGRERVSPDAGIPRTVDDTPRSPGLNSAVPGFALGSFGPVGSRGAAEAADAGPAPTFYSQLRLTLEEKMPNRANGQQIMGILRGSAVKPDEITWTGLDDFLREQKGPVTKQQVLDFLDQNAVTVEEVVKGQPLIRWQQQGDALVATEAPTLRVVQEADGSYRVQHDGRTSPVPFATVEEAKQAAQDIATDPKVGLLPKPENTRYDQYTLPGGENYRELLITRPEQGQRRFRYYDPSGRPGGLVDSEEQAQEVVRMAGGRYAPEHVADPSNPSYRSSHWDEPNVLAHVRFNERVAPDGKRVLLIEEIQSDWHQEGRKSGYKGANTPDAEVLRLLDEAGYTAQNNGVNWVVTAKDGSDVPNQLAGGSARSQFAGNLPQVAQMVLGRRDLMVGHNAVPDAPFKKTWPELAIKRMIRWAAENDFDRIAWPPGAVHADRYSLAQSVDDVRYITKDGATGTLVAYKDGAEIVEHKNVAADKLGDYIGQDAARKLFEYEPDIRSYGDEYRLTGRDLTSVGGEGMKGFYDKIVPETAQKIGKKFGARVGMSEIPTTSRYTVQPARFGLWNVFDDDMNIIRSLPSEAEAEAFAQSAGRMQRVHSMDITPAMRESVVKQGQPMFSALPFDPTSAAMGGAAGAMSEGEDGEAGDPLRTAAAFLLAGVGGGMSPRARRALQNAMKRAEALKAAGKADEAAAVVDAALRQTGGYNPRLSREPVLPGMEPPRRVPGDAGPSVSELPNRAPALGDVPPSAIDQRALPGMDPLRDAQAPPLEDAVREVQIPESLNTPRLQNALSAAERRAENMRRRGLTTPSAWDWIKQAGYAGIYGPSTFTSAVVGGVQELVGGQAKEFTRAVASGRPGSYGAQLGAQVRAMPDSLAGLGRVLFGSDSASTAAVSGGSQGTANLSERVVNPVGHFVARLLERPGEILTEAPDAVFRPLFTAQGMTREARTIAAEAGLRGRNAAAYADELMQAADDLRANPDAALASDEARRIVEAGSKYADELGYKGPASGFGRWLGQLSRRDDPIGVVASFLVPFPAMAERMSRSAIRSTPGLGLLPAVRRGQASKFDVIYDQAFGTAVAGGLAYWAFNGGITGSGPADPEKRQMMIDQGWQPNSVLVAGHYIQTRVFGRFQPMLDTAGEIHDALAYGKEDAKPGAMAADLVARGTKIATNQIGLSGLADLNDMLTRSFSSRFPGWVARSGIRYVPYGGVMRAAATATDPTARKPEGWGDEVFPTTAIAQNAQMAVPGLRQALPAAQDALGRDAQNPQQGFGAIAPRVTAQRDDPVIRLFQDAGVDIGKPSDAITVGARNIPVALKPAEQRRWNTLRGQMIEQYAGQYTGNPEFMALPPAQKERYLKAFLAKASDYASKMLQSEMDIEDLTQRATAGALKKASGQ